MLPAMIRITDSCPSIVSRVWLVSAFKGALQGFSNCFIHLFCSRVVLYLSPLLAAGFPVTVTKNNPVMMNHILSQNFQILLNDGAKRNRLPTKVKFTTHTIRLL
jgi:hypothetical protein